MQHFRRLSVFVRPYRRQAALAFFLTTAMVALDLTIPRLIQRIIDEGVARREYAVVFETSLTMLGVSLFSLLSALGNNVYSIRVGEGVARDLRDALFVKIQTLSYGNLDRLQTGPLLVRLTSDIGAVQRIVQVSLRIGGRAPMLMLGSLLLMIRTSPRLVLTLLPLLLLTVLILSVFVIFMEPLFSRIQGKLERLSTVLQENIAGSRVVRAFVRHELESQRFAAANTDFTQDSTWVMRVMAGMSPTLALLVNSGVVVVVWAGGGQAIRGELSVGQIVAFINYLLTIMAPLAFMTMLANDLAAGRASLRRILALLDTVPDIPCSADDAGDRTAVADAAAGDRDGDRTAVAGAGDAEFEVALPTAATPASVAACVTVPGTASEVIFEQVSLRYDRGGGSSGCGSEGGSGGGSSRSGAGNSDGSRDVDVGYSSGDSDRGGSSGSGYSSGDSDRGGSSGSGSSGDSDRGGSRSGAGAGVAVSSVADVLTEIDLRIAAGRTTAIIGATGAGKSSLLQLIPRFYDVTGGRILLDGVDLRDIPRQQLLSGIGCVPQESILFSGSVRDNIRYGRPQAGDREVERAARLAQTHDFIMSLPDGYATPVSPRGANFSGGQRQRLAIARALLLRPRLLLLDDSTSALDATTENLLYDALRSLNPQPTIVMVAQRISTVLHADQIMVLDRGRLVTTGTHAELIRSSPIYQEIYQSQLGPVSSASSPPLNGAHPPSAQPASPHAS